MYQMKNLLFFWTYFALLLQSFYDNSFTSGGSGLIYFFFNFSSHKLIANFDDFSIFYCFLTVHFQNPKSKFWVLHQNQKHHYMIVLALLIFHLKAFFSSSSQRKSNKKFHFLLKEKNYLKGIFKVSYAQIIHYKDVQYIISRGHL